MLNTFSGLIISLILTALLNAWENPVVYLGDGLTGLEVFLWTGLMTIVSILRSYCWRRFFVKRLHKLMKINKRNRKISKANYKVRMKGNVGVVGIAKIPNVLWESER